MKILIVEWYDYELQPKHEGEDIIVAAGHECVIAGNYSDALSLIGGRSGIDGVITDILVPDTYDAKNYEYHSKDQCGLGVALECERVGMPFVFCIAGMKNGIGYNWITHFAKHRRNWPDVIDIENSPNPRSSGKKWDKALEVLITEIEKRRSSLP